MFTRQPPLSSGVRLRQVRFLGLGAGNRARFAASSCRRLGASLGWPARSVVQFPGWARNRFVKIIPLITNVRCLANTGGARLRAQATTARLRSAAGYAHVVFVATIFGLNLHPLRQLTCLTTRSSGRLRVGCGRVWFTAAAAA
jgi:hypothetical protein